MGLRASRALAALALLVVLLVPQFQLCGFADPDAPFSKATQAVPATKPEPWSACRPDSRREAWSALTDLDAWTYTAGSAVAARVRWMAAYHSRFTDLPVAIGEDIVRLWDHPPTTDSHVASTARRR